jgi:hypothetical protein
MPPTPENICQSIPALLRLTLAPGRFINLSRCITAAIIGELYINGCEFSRLTGSFKRRISSELYYFFLRGTTADLEGSPDRTRRYIIHADAFGTDCGNITPGSNFKKCSVF